MCIRDSINECDEIESVADARVFVQSIGMTASKESGAEIGRVQELYHLAKETNLKLFLQRRSDVPLDLLNHDLEYRDFVESLGEIPDKSPLEIANDVVDFLSLSKEKQTINAFMQVPAKALSEFEILKNEIYDSGCVLFPRKAPSEGGISEISADRKSLRLIYPECHVVLMLYCMNDCLEWLSSTFFKYGSVVSHISRETDNIPEPLVVDFIGEAKDLAEEMGVPWISWEKGSNPSELWSQVRKVVFS